MADHGTIALADPPVPTLDLGSTFSPTAKSLLHGELLLDLVVIPTMQTGAYSIAGTIDNSYHAPTIGQLWPRGDLDAP